MAWLLNVQLSYDWIRLSTKRSFATCVTFIQIRSSRCVIAWCLSRLCHSMCVFEHSLPVSLSKTAHCRMWGQELLKRFCSDKTINDEPINIVHAHIVAPYTAPEWICVLCFVMHIEKTEKTIIKNRNDFFFFGLSLLCFVYSMHARTPMNSVHRSLPSEILPFIYIKYTVVCVFYRMEHQQ